MHRVSCRCRLGPTPVGGVQMSGRSVARLVDAAATAAAQGLKDQRALQRLLQARMCAVQVVACEDLLVGCILRLMTPAIASFKLCLSGSRLGAQQVLPSGFWAPVTISQSLPTHLIVGCSRRPPSFTIWSVRTPVVRRCLHAWHTPRPMYTRCSLTSPHLTGALLPWLLHAAAPATAAWLPQVRAVPVAAAAA